MKLKLLSFASAVMFLAASPLPAHADAGDSPTLKRIAERGMVSIGHRETSIPFSYMDQSGKPIGYSIDICMKIVDAVRAQLGKPDLGVKMVPVTGQTRIPLLANGTIDIECGSTTNNLTRQRQVSYLQTTFITGTKIAVRKDSGVKEIEDLKGKIIGVASGTTNEKAIKDHIAENRLDIKITHVKDHSQGWLALETGRVDAYGSDDVLLYGLISKSKAPDGYAVVGRYLSFDPYAIMVPRNDDTFQRLGTAVLSELMRSGELEKMYNKWFSPGPTDIKMPMSDTLKTAFQIQALPE
ncbi:MAG: amino acid ABC transporter substrate-binding protein [Burkholderiaceae bacterium]|nr:amino acid ABC transporter substrate-binding protein [Burkholderiaceae bacterium]